MARRRRVRRTDRDEAGFMLVMLALALTTIFISAALAVDVGGWYSRAAEVQRAADAAALAGVVWMPDFPASESAALAAAARNGFVSGGNITITASPVPSSSRQLSVVITDTMAPRHFSATSPSLVRKATAEYILPVPLGSPKNTFGTGDLLPLADREYFWAAVNGYCAGHESGDLKLARYESYSTQTSGPNCNNNSALSPDYDPAGYQYAVHVPAGSPNLALDVYDGGYNRTGSTTEMNFRPGENQTATTVFEVFGPDNTPLDTSDNPLLSTTPIVTNAAAQQNTWKRLYTSSGLPESGTYYLRVRTLATQITESRMSNGFALRAFTGPSFLTCTSIVGQPGYAPACPQIHGVGAMSIFANLSGTTATFYLAEVAALHAGKTMQLTLFDAGEGAQKIEVLDPIGGLATFSWRTPCNNPPAPMAGACSGSNVTSLDVSSTGPQPYSGLNGDSKYNDRRVILDVKLPVDYVGAYGANVWWRIKYTVGTSATDRTTWSVNIVGDPVHLVED